MNLAKQLLLTSLLCVGFSSIASAGNFSFTGAFGLDNDVQFFTFTLNSPATVTLQTLGFGGSGANLNGTNAAGQVIAAGGFESVLQVYNISDGTAASSTIFPGPDPLCAPRTPDPNRGNFCQDDYSQVSLAAGGYLLALTQNANVPNGNLSDGFFYRDTVPDSNFNSGFVGTFGYPGNGQWAVDILNVSAAAAVTSAPEPGSMVLVAGGALLALIRNRKARRTGAPQA